MFINKFIFVKDNSVGSELFKIIIILIVQEPVDVSDPDEELLALWEQGGPPFSPKLVRKFKDALG